MPTKTRLFQLLEWLEPAATTNFTTEAITRLPQEFFVALKEFFPRLILKDTDQEGSLNLLNQEELAVSPNGSEALKKLYFNLRALEAAEEAMPLEQSTTGDTRQVVIHNRLLATKLRDTYDSESFQEIFSFCRENGVFDVKINSQTGLVSTSQGEENWHMSGRQWVTDTVRCQDIEKYQAPQAWRQALFSLIKFYNGAQEIAAMEESIADPSYYREGGLTNGVAHIFLPETFTRDKSWFNNKRLESHGLALKALCDTIMAGCIENLDWGFTKAELAQNQEEICRTIANLASYLRAINTNKAGQFDFSAPSAGNWEEIPFPEGLTWDTEAMRSAFQSLHNLLNNPRHNHREELGKIRESLRTHAPWLNIEPCPLEEILTVGQEKITKRLFGESLPIEHPGRPLDASLAFISTSTIVFHEDPAADVEHHLQLLETLEEHLVLSHGIIRYAPFTMTLKDGSTHQVFDSYLADNYWLLPPLRSLLTGREQHLDFGSSDCSDQEAYVARVKLARPGSEAQWCFVSVLAEGYICQIEKLLLFGGIHENQKLLKHAYRKACEFLNRSFARITGENKVKANGQNCPAFSIPEAYETVSAGLNHSQLSYLPGVNTPLAWGQASLFNACRKFALLLEEAPELTKL